MPLCANVVNQTDRRRKILAGVQILWVMIAKLSRLQRITLVLFVIVVTNWVVVSTTGYSLLGGDLFMVFFLVFLVLSTLMLVGTLMRKVLLKGRNRLS